MNRLRTLFFLMGGLFLLIPLFAEDSGSTVTPSLSLGGQDATGSATTAPGDQSQVAPEPVAPIVLPGAYGTAPIALTPGQGRFAKDPYDFTLSFQQGYDSNANTTHVNPMGSMTSNGGVGFEMQSANPRNVFTFDSTLALVYYWNRPGSNPENYTGDLKFLVFHRASPRLNASVTFDMGYYSQPNFSSLNASTNQQQGDYLMGNGRMNVSYQWSSKFQTNTSYSLNSTMYQKTIQQTSNIVENTIGNEFRFTLTPRTTLVAEGRFTVSDYPKNSVGNSDTVYGLLGTDYAFNRRLATTLRGGMQFRDYTNMIKMPETVNNAELYNYNGRYTSSLSGNSQASPYAEATMIYIYGHQSTFQWTNRFGLDSSGAAANKVTSFRTGLNFNHVLTAKTTITFGLNYNVSSTVTADTRIQQALYIGPFIYDSTLTTQSNPTTTQDQVNAVLGVKFLMTPKFSLSANYTFTDVTNPSQPSNAGNYYRNQISLGGVYTF